MASVRPRSHVLVSLIATFIDSMKREVFTDYGGGAVTGSTAAGGTGATGADGTGPVTGRSAGETMSRLFRFENLAASGTARSAALAGNNAGNALAGFSSPAIPRAPQAVFGAGWDGGNLTVHGTNRKDQVISEVVADPGAGGATVQLVKPFKTITAAEKGAVGVDPATVQIQDGHAIGIEGLVDGAFGLLAVDNVAEAVTVDASNGTFTPTTAPNGAHDYTLLVNIDHDHEAGDLAGPSHTHTGPSHTHGVGSLAAGPVTAPIHFDRAEYAVTTAVATTLETSRALLRSIATAYDRHIHDELPHAAVDAVNGLSDTLAAVLAEIDAGALGVLETYANEIKASYNAHRSEAGVHAATDAGHAISSPDATDQTSLNTLLNELKTDLNAHMASGLATPSWRAVDV